MRKRRPTSVEWMMLCSFVLALSASLVWLEEGTRYQDSRRQRLYFQQQQQGDGTSTIIQTFKILQLADMHFGENSWTDWGPQQDVNTFAVLDSVIRAEQPDLIVLSGDQITANNIDKNATSVYRSICNHLAKYEIPWAMVFGNHDDAPLETEAGTAEDNDNTLIVTTPAKTSREDLFHVDHSFAPLSLTQMGPKDLFGTSNYILDVYSAPAGTTANDEVALQLLFLDTGGGSLPKQLESNQVNWFQKQRRRQQRRKNNRKNNNIPMIAFQHIPTQEFVYDGDICQGMQDDGVDAIEKDPKIVDALVRDGNIHLLVVGHNHGNDYCCPYNNDKNNNNNNNQQQVLLHLCFGRHSGYGGYGSWDRGARVYQIQIRQHSSSRGADKDSSYYQAGSNTKVKWKSWVRMESGDIQDVYSPFDDNNDEGENN